ncbi:MAG: MerR family DNA-binding transcriptional regulator [Chloroflexi bacterium]|nr:MerR family DNA-binding transcriptional regulator [Chloroflexota bacterium]
MLRKLRIGQLAERVGMHPKTIRYYEDIGLIPKAQRDSSGYRVYPESEAARLKLISRSKLLGLSLKEIKEITDYAAAGRCDNAQSRLAAMIGGKISEIDARIAELVALKVDLQRYELELACRTQDVPQPTGRRSLADCICVGDGTAGADRRDL